MTISVVLLTSTSALAQIGGQRSYEFLNVPYTARLMGLGGVNVSQVDQDVNLFLSNPALVGDTLDGYASANYLGYFATTSLSSFTYARKVEQVSGMVAVGIQHMGLGEFEGYDVVGNPTQSFNSGETAITLSHSREAGVFRMGANVKFINSNIAGFRSNALILDLGGAFVHPRKQLSVGLALKNMGFVLSDYTETSDSKVPFDVQVGATFKPEHMPFRFSLTAQQLGKNSDQDIAYFEANNNLQTDAPNGFDRAARHVVIGTELLISKAINVRFGYNHLVKQELKLESTGGGAGFSYGFMIKVKAFEFAYSRGGYHVAGGANQFTLSVNTNKMLRRATN